MVLCITLWVLCIRLAKFIFDVMLVHTDITALHVWFFVIFVRCKFAKILVCSSQTEFFVRFISSSLNCYWLIWSAIDLLFGAVPIIYEKHRGWNTLQGSLPFLAVLLGTFIAAALNVAYSQLVFAPNVDKHGGKTQPEKRLIPMSTLFWMRPGDSRAINPFIMHSAWFYHVSDWVLLVRMDFEP